MYISLAMFTFTIQRSGLLDYIDAATTAQWYVHAFEQFLFLRDYNSMYNNSHK